MLFNSLEFLLFFPVVFYAYYLLPHRFRWVLLLVSSYVFYMSWRPEYALLILGSTAVDYLAARGIAHTDDERRRRIFLGMSLVTNLGLLFSFKYANFAAGAVTDVAGLFGMSVDLGSVDVVLPVGISFYTFQTMGYTIDVYRRKVHWEPHPGRFALYVAFWPQLVAGPIERAGHLLPELRKKVDFDIVQVESGARQALQGFFKKVVVADRIGVYVDVVYSNPEAYHGLPAILATLLFAFQIYCDFSGYSDIAIGTARMLGIDLMENFRRPYHARSIGEFWHRWHISLSTWFRDYVYIPLGGNRVPRGRWLSNLFATFVISGLWHGANWTFVVWGALHGAYMILGVTFRSLRARLVDVSRAESWPRGRAALQWAWTFFWVCLAWVFFRASSVSDAITLIGGMTDLDQPIPWDLNSADLRTNLLLGGAGLLYMEVVHLLQTRLDTNALIARRPAFIRVLLYAIFIVLILLMGEFGGQSFIYFQF